MSETSNKFNCFYEENLLCFEVQVGRDTKFKT